MLHIRRNGHGNTARQADDGIVADKAGLGDDHLVTGTDEGAHGKIDGLAAADGDHHLRRRIIGTPLLYYTPNHKQIIPKKEIKLLIKCALKLEPKLLE